MLIMLELLPDVWVECLSTKTVFQSHPLPLQVVICDTFARSTVKLYHDVTYLNLRWDCHSVSLRQQISENPLPPLVVPHQVGTRNPAIKQY